MARPEKYKAEYARMAAKACELGATDADLAELFCVSRRTINYWKVTQPKFAENLRLGKQEADARVERSLYERAIGYEHPDMHVSNYQGEVTLTPIQKRYAPDTTAAIFWLKNRDPENWRDKQEVQHSGELKHTGVMVAPAQTTTEDWEKQVSGED